MIAKLEWSIEYVVKGPVANDECPTLSEHYSWVEFLRFGGNSAATQPDTHGILAQDDICYGKVGVTIKYDWAKETVDGAMAQTRGYHFGIVKRPEASGRFADGSSGAVRLPLIAGLDFEGQGMGRSWSYKYSFRSDDPECCECVRGIKHDKVDAISGVSSSSL